MNKLIEITNFAKRHFDPNFNGTKIKSHTPEQVLEHLSFIKDLDNKLQYGIIAQDLLVVRVIDGEFPFSKIITVLNFSDAKVGVAKITLDNIQFLRSDYIARTEAELPVLSRWLDFPPPFEVPEAKYLSFVVYSKEQLAKEGDHIEADYGVVAIMAHDFGNPEPMSPITIMRNSLGIQEGGNGERIDRVKYLQSVNFWREYAMIK